MHRFPAPPFHSLQGGARVFVPALVVPKDVPVRIGHPGELRDGIRQCAQFLFAAAQFFFGSFSGGDIASHCKLYGFAGRRITHRYRMSLHPPPRSFESDDLKFELALVAFADIFVEINERLAIFGCQKRIDALSDYVGIAARFHHLTACGIHSQQSPVRRDHFDAFWSGLHNVAETFFTFTQSRLGALLRRDVPCHLGGSNDPPGRVLHRRNSEGDINAAAIFSQANSREMVNAFTTF